MGGDIATLAGMVARAEPPTTVRRGPVGARADADAGSRASGVIGLAAAVGNRRFGRLLAQRPTVVGSSPARSLARTPWRGPERSPTAVRRGTAPTERAGVTALQEAVAARRMVAPRRGRRALARATKTVRIDAVKLRGARKSRGHDVARANAIFAPCNVRFRLRRVDPTNAESDAWLGGDTDIASSSSCTPTAEEVAAYTGAGSAYPLTGRIRAFYVHSISGAPFDAYSFHTGCGSSTNEMAVISDTAGGRELAHELGHILLNGDNSVHSTDPNNVMADPNPGRRFNSAQCATIFANA